MYTPTVSAANGIKDWRAVGLDPDTPYFNAGVMVVDLPLWRSLDIRTQAIAYLQRTDITVTLFDQEALNAVVAGRWRELPPIWNATRYWYKSHRRTGPYASVLDEARILHFLSEDKPWTLNSKIPEAQTRAFYDALDRSDLAGWRP
jgi:lipopolysaccharide biosynthesis glycosyltransferase